MLIAKSFIRQLDKGVLNGIRFPLLFVLFIIISFLIGYYIPPNLDLAFRKMTADGAVFLAGMSGINSFSESATIIIIEGKRLAVVSECTGISYLLIFISAVLAYPSTIRKKVYGVGIGSILIISMNMVRIVFLGWLGRHYPSQFDFFHYYMWEGGFLLVVLLIWGGWVNSRFLISCFNEASGEKSSGIRGLPLENWRMKVAMVISLCLIFVILSEGYLIFLAKLSNWIVHGLGFEGGVIRSDGEEIVIIFWGRVPWELSVNIYYLLPFAIAALLLERDRLSPGFIAESAALVVIQVCSVVAVYWALLHDASVWQISVIFGAVVMVSPWLAAYGLYKTVVIRGGLRESAGIQHDAS